MSDTKPSKVDEAVQITAEELKEFYDNQSINIPRTITLLREIKSEMTDDPIFGDTLALLDPVIENLVRKYIVAKAVLDEVQLRSKLN